MNKEPDTISNNKYLAIPELKPGAESNSQVQLSVNSEDTVIAQESGNCYKRACNNINENLSELASQAPVASMPLTPSPNHSLNDEDDVELDESEMREFYFGKSEKKKDLFEDVFVEKSLSYSNPEWIALCEEGLRDILPERSQTNEVEGFKNSKMELERAGENTVKDGNNTYEIRKENGQLMEGKRSEEDTVQRQEKIIEDLDENYDFYFSSQLDNDSEPQAIINHASYSSVKPTNGKPKNSTKRKELPNSNTIYSYYKPSTVPSQPQQQQQQQPNQHSNKEQITHNYSNYSRTTPPKATGSILPITPATASSNHGLNQITPISMHYDMQNITLMSYSMVDNSLIGIIKDMSSEISNLRKQVDELKGVKESMGWMKDDIMRELRLINSKISNQPTMNNNNTPLPIDNGNEFTTNMVLTPGDFQDSLEDFSKNEDIYKAQEPPEDPNFEPVFTTGRRKKIEFDVEALKKAELLMEKAEENYNEKQNTNTKKAKIEDEELVDPYKPKYVKRSNESFKKKNHKSVPPPNKFSGTSKTAANEDEDMADEDFAKQLAKIVAKNRAKKQTAGGNTGFVVPLASSSPNLLRSGFKTAKESTFTVPVAKKPSPSLSKDIEMINKIESKAEESPRDQITIEEQETSQKNDTKIDEDTTTQIKEGRTTSKKAQIKGTKRSCSTNDAARKRLTKKKEDSKVNTSVGFSNSGQSLEEQFKINNEDDNISLINKAKKTREERKIANDQRKRNKNNIHIMENAINPSDIPISKEDGFKTKARKIGINEISSQSIKRKICELENIETKSAKKVCKKVDNSDDESIYKENETIQSLGNHLTLPKVVKYLEEIFSSPDKISINEILQSQKDYMKVVNTLMNDDDFINLNSIRCEEAHLIDVKCLCKYEQINAQSCDVCHERGNVSYKELTVVLNSFNKDKNKEVVAEDWMKIQYRFAVWKLAHFSKCNNNNRKFVRFADILFSIQKKYEKEFVHFRPSFFAKVFADASVARSHAILLISSIRKESYGYSLELYDGHFPVNSQIVTTEERKRDNQSSSSKKRTYEKKSSKEVEEGGNECYDWDARYISDLIIQGKLKEGQKIHVINSKFVMMHGFDSNTPYLSQLKYTNFKISINGLAKASNVTAKLGLQKKPCFFKSLSSFSDKSEVPVFMIDVIVIRKYPLYYKDFNNNKFIKKSRKTGEKFLQDIQDEKEERLQELKETGVMEEQLENYAVEYEKRCANLRMAYKVLVQDTKSFMRDHQKRKEKLAKISFFDATENDYDDISIGDRIRFFNLLTPQKYKGSLREDQLNLTFRLKKSKYQRIKKSSIVYIPKDKLLENRQNKFVDFLKSYKKLKETFRENKSEVSEMEKKSFIKTNEFTIVGLVLKVMKKSEVYFVDETMFLYVLQEKTVPAERSIITFQDVRFDSLVSYNKSEHMACIGKFGHETPTFEDVSKENEIKFCCLKTSKNSIIVAREFNWLRTEIEKLKDLNSNVTELNKKIQDISLISGVKLDPYLERKTPLLKTLRRKKSKL